MIGEFLCVLPAGEGRGLSVVRKSLGKLGGGREEKGKVRHWEVYRMRENGKKSTVERAGEE